MKHVAVICTLFAISIGLALGQARRASSSAKSRAESKPTIADARAFLDKAEAHLLELSNASGRASWVQATYITEDTEILAAEATQRAVAAGVEYAKEAQRFDGVPLPEDLQRKMKLLKVALTLPAPADQKESEELTRIVTQMEGV